MTASADNIRPSWALVCDRLSATPIMAWKELNMAWYVDSSIMLTEDTARTTASIDWNACLGPSSMNWLNQPSPSLKRNKGEEKISTPIGRERTKLRSYPKVEHGL